MHGALVAHDKQDMAKITDHDIGVDISKAHFDAFDLETGRAAQFTNGKTGFRSFRKWPGGRKIARIGSVLNSVYVSRSMGVSNTVTH